MSSECNNRVVSNDTKTSSGGTGYKNGAGLNSEKCCCNCNTSNDKDSNLEIPETKSRIISHSNIFVNEPIPIQSGINHTMDIINPNNISNSTTLNTIINESVFMDKYNIIDIRPMGSGAKKGQGFQENVPNEISHLITQKDYLKFIKSFNRIYNYFYLLLINVLFLIAGITFPIFIVKITTLLIAVICGCSIIIFAAIFYFLINKYIKGKRMSLMEKRIKLFNMKMDSISCPLQFCIMRVQEAVPGRPHYSVERLIIRITYSSSNNINNNNNNNNNNNINNNNNNNNININNNNNKSIGNAEC